MNKVTLKYPVRHPKISQVFDTDNSNHPKRKSFYTLFDNKHPGVDFELDENTEVFAAYPGIVVRREFHQGMGNVIGTRYCNLVILYAHLNNFNKDLGDIVKQGDLLGLSGATGSACPTPHLHFEMRDISKSTLKEMVFDPPFEKTLYNLKEVFIYTVNNKNTPKTLGYLSRRYFGSTSKSYIGLLRDYNQSLVSFGESELIPQDHEVIIPNYLFSN